MKAFAGAVVLWTSLLGVADIRPQSSGEPGRNPAAALGTLPAPKAGGVLRILLVDDNASPNNIAGNTHRNAGSDDIYRELVAAAVGGDAKAWSVEVAPYRKDGPTFERLREFNLVVWYTGDSYGAGADTLSKQDEDTVRRYLEETGGAFVLVSPGYVNNLLYGATWQSADYPFLKEVMGVDGVAPLAQRFASGRVIAFDGNEFEVAHPGAAETQFSAVNSNGAAIVFTATLDPLRTAEGGVPVAIANPYGAGRIVYVGFTLENIPAAARDKAFGVVLEAATGRAVSSARVVRATPVTASSDSSSRAPGNPTVRPTPAFASPALVPATAMPPASTPVVAGKPIGSASGNTPGNQTIVPPSTLVTVNPAPAGIITSPAVRFQWRYPDQPSPVRYEICVSEPDQACSAPSAVVFRLSGAPLAEVTLENRTGPGVSQAGAGPAVPAGTSNPLYFYPANLPSSLQGKHLQWSIKACTPDTGRATLDGKTVERCAASGFSRMIWALPVPALGAPGDRSLLGTTPDHRRFKPVFSWEYGDTQGVDFFRLCIAKPGVNCPDKPGVARDTLVVDSRGSKTVTVTQDLSPFMGLTLSWTVGACNAAMGCAYPPARQLQLPILDGTFDAIYQVTQNDKCLNCHLMHKDNAVYLRHIEQGRFTREEMPPSDVSDYVKTDKCRTCHSVAAGFPSHWRAPGSAGRLITRETMSFDHCESLQSPGDSIGQYDIFTHLKESEDVHWAVEQIPGMGVARWRELVASWDRVCPCDRLNKTRCRPHGQFIP